MIFGNLNNKELYKKLDKGIELCLNFIENNDLKEFDKGKHEINGEEFFVNIVEYDLKDEKDRFWEAHRDYLDLHFIIRGEERIRVSFIENCDEKSYVKEDDFVSFNSCESVSELILNQGDFLLCYPQDVHMTALKVKGDMNIKKAIFKIKI